MLCTACDTRNDVNARFCRMCGTSLAHAPTTGQTVVMQTNQRTRLSVSTCQQCSRVNPRGAKFCVFCATPLTGTTPTHTPGGQFVMQGAGGGVVALQGLFASSVMNAGGINLLIRAVWFACIGLWLGLVWTIFAWLFNLSIILLPVGVWMLNRIPQVMTLHAPAQPWMQLHNGVVLVRQPNRIPFPLRALWFLIIGSWASLVWMLIAWGLSASIIFMPIAFWMFDRVPTITTLATE